MTKREIKFKDASVEAFLFYNGDKKVLVSLQIHWSFIWNIMNRNYQDKQLKTTAGDKNGF